MVNDEGNKFGERHASYPNMKGVDYIEESKDY